MKEIDQFPGVLDKSRLNVVAPPRWVVVPPSGNRDLLVVKPPGEKFHDRPDSDKQTGPTLLGDLSHSCRGRGGI
jgi:hypothetical protein